MIRELSRSLVLVTVLLIALGCNRSKSSEPQTPGNPGKTPSQRKPTDPQKPQVENKITTLLPTVESVRYPKLRKAMLDYYRWYNKQATAFIIRHRALVEAEVSKSHRFRPALAAAYKGANYGFLFFDAKGLNPRGTALQKHVAELERHAINPAPFFKHTLEPLFEKHKALAKAYEMMSAGQFNTPKLKALWAFIRKHRTVPSLETMDAAFKEAGLDEADDTLMTQVLTSAKGMFGAKALLNKAQIALDTRFLRNFFLYTMSFKHTWLYDILLDQQFNQRYRKLSQKLLVDAWNEIKDADFEKGLVAMWPPGDQYQGLLAAYEKYRKLASTYNFKKLKSGVRLKLKVRRRHPLVKGVKLRLKVRGLYSGAIDDLFDADLEKVVRLYQKTHQMRVTGWIDRWLTRSLNIPFSRRARVLALNLRRWRKTSTRLAAGVFVRVNIPAMELYLYENGKKTRTHRVIVGSNKKRPNEKGEIGHFNRTAFFYRQMKTVVLNPVWRVPPSIKRLELDKELEKEPNYYQKNNFKVMTRPDGTEIVWQMPGKGNALGEVKFLFPNRHNIYMHDTPKKRLFEIPNRAFSHGCIRVEHPLSLAEHLFKLDGSLTPEAMKKILKKRDETHIKVKTKITVHIEYYTAGVDADGNIYFYDDVYRQDKDYFESLRKKSKNGTVGDNKITRS